MLLFANHNEGDITRSASTSKTSSTACGTPSDRRSDESLEVIEQMTYLMCIRVPDDALSPRTLAELCKLVESLGTPPLFVEPHYEDMATRTISRETGAALFAPDPIVTVPADAP